MTELSPLDLQFKDIKIDNFFDFIEKNTTWADELVKKLDFQRNAYQATAYDCKLIDYSFYYRDTNGVYFLPIHLINHKLSLLHLPISLVILGSPEINYEEIFNKICEIFKASDARNIILSTDLVRMMNLTPNSLIKTLKIAQIDLLQNEDRIFKSISKGHKSSIKSGQKILDTKIYNYSNFSQDHFNELISLYTEVAKKNKSDQFWQFVKNAILENSAFFTLATYNSKLASCQLFYNGTTKVSYALAAYDRDLMAEGLSLSHAPLFFAIIESKRMGFKSFELGYLLDDIEDEKIQSIFKFKSKFVSNLIFSEYYEINQSDFMTVN
jgi:hypothetical protein